MAIVLLSVMALSSIVALFLPLIGMKSANGKEARFVPLAFLAYMVCSIALMGYVCIGPYDSSRMIDVGGVLHRLFFVLWILFTLAVFLNQRKYWGEKGKLVTSLYSLAALAIFLLQFIPENILFVEDFMTESAQMAIALSMLASFLIVAGTWKISRSV